MRGFVGIGAEQGFERRLGRTVSAPEGARLGADRGSQRDHVGLVRTSAASGSNAAISAWLASRLRLSSREYSLGSMSCTGVSEPSIAALRTRMSSFSQRSATAPASLPIEFAVGEVERGDGRAAAGGVNPLLDLLQRGGGAGDEDDMRAGRGKRFGGRRADAAAGAGDKRQLSVKGLRIAHGPRLAA